MPHSPIVHIELLTVGRRRRYFFIRVAYGLLMLLAMWICYVSSISRYQTTIDDAARFAASFFAYFSCIQLAAVMFLTPPMIAGTIASEHERRTIDYLLTTQLGDTEIALGKFAARMWAVFSQLLAGLPILAIAMSMGGIGLRQLLESFGITLLSLASVGSLSIAVSSRTTKARDAVTRTFVIVIGAMLLPAMAWLICGYFEYVTRGTPLETLFRVLRETTLFGVELNPFVYLVMRVLRPPGTSSIDPTTFAACYAGVSALCCCWAVRSVRRFYVKKQGALVRPTDGPPPATAGGNLPIVPGAVDPATTEAAVVGQAILIDEPRDVGASLELPNAIAAPVAVAYAATEAVGGSPDATTTAASASEILDWEQDRQAGIEPPGGEDIVSVGRYVRRRELLDADKPMWWKERLAQRTLGKLGWGARIATVLLFGVAWLVLFLCFINSLDWKLSHFDRWFSPIMVFAASGAPLFGCFAMLLVVARAAGSITSEREQDTWISLISTPLEAGEIVRAKMLGAAFSVRHWCVLILATWGCCMLVHPTLVLAAPIMALVYALGLWFAASLGLYFSLRSRTSIKAMGSALAIIVFVAGLGPVFLATLGRTEEPLAFSLPVVIGTPHFAAIEIIERAVHGSSFSTHLTLTTVAAILYLAVTIGLYSACIRRFDEFIGRTTGRPRTGDDREA